MQRTKYTFAFGATDTSLSMNMCDNGVMTHYTITTPNFTNNSTTTLSIKDPDGTTIWTGSAHNERLTALVASLSVPVGQGFTLVATLSGAAGGTGGSVVVATFIDTRN